MHTDTWWSWFILVGEVFKEDVWWMMTVPMDNSSAPSPRELAEHLYKKVFFMPCLTVRCIWKFYCWRVGCSFFSGGFQFASLVTVIVFICGWTGFQITWKYEFEIIHFETTPNSWDKWLSCLYVWVGFQLTWRITTFLKTCQPFLYRINLPSLKIQFDNLVM